MILKELFTYFSQFVPSAVLSDLFQFPTGLEYSTFRNSLTRQTEPSTVISGIRSFIIGVDAEAVRQKISQSDGTFLFVEYGNLSSRIDPVTDRKEDRLHVAVTIATPMPNDADQPGMLLNNDNCMAMMKTIRQKLRDDYNSTGNIKWCEFPNSMQPFYNKALANSSGWSMEFDIVGYNIA